MFSSQIIGHMYDKIFVVGFNKTATTTFHALFEANDLSSQHSREWDDDVYTCFSDGMLWLNKIKRLKLKHPNSIFILNIRPLRAWLLSRFRHGLRMNQAWAYPCTSQLCITWINNREEYYNQVLEWFKGAPDRLIIVDITNPNWMQYISEILDFKQTDIPSENVFAIDYQNSGERDIIQIVDSTLDDLQYTQEERDNILFRDTSLTEHYCRIYRNNLGIFC